ncbi:hypothetical protein RHSIM_Rhsim07G0184800 [Rhododendron simsii]|uniref:Uncharacterized protein n=1 Tax=Rhododendron simsii TaxID=118357 RepID=A0A834LK21_RHOSS|nr:hypothetical protein RHSIM_Rhsim07G0184800 [Rhododendron simsii]
MARPILEQANAAQPIDSAHIRNFSDMFFIFLAAGRGMMKHLPKFGLVRSWYKFFMLLIIYGVNVAAFVAGLAKAADDVDETHKEFWANIQAFLMTLSYVYLYHISKGCAASFLGAMSEVLGM